MADKRNLIFLALLACLAIPLACGGDKSNGTLCASCGEEGEAACGRSIVPTDDIELFCGNAPVDRCNICFLEDGEDLDGNGVVGNYVCEVQLVCVQPKDSAAQRCYPAKPDGKAHEAFQCGGVTPDV